MGRPYENEEVNANAGLSNPDLERIDDKKGTVPVVIFPVAYVSGKTTAVKDENHVPIEESRLEELGVRICSDSEMKADHQSDVNDRKQVDSGDVKLPALEKKKYQEEKRTEHQKKQRKKGQVAKDHVRVSRKRDVQTDSGDSLTRRKGALPSGKSEVKYSGQEPLRMTAQSFGKQRNRLKQRSAGDAKRAVGINRRNLTEVNKNYNKSSCYYIPMKILRLLQIFAKIRWLFFCKFPWVFVVLLVLSKLPVAHTCTLIQSEHMVTAGSNHTECLPLTLGKDYGLYNEDNVKFGSYNVFVGLGYGWVNNWSENKYHVRNNGSDCFVTQYNVSPGYKIICANATGGNDSVCRTFLVQPYPHDDIGNNVLGYMYVLGYIGAALIGVALVVILIGCFCKSQLKMMYIQLRTSIVYHGISQRPT